jgi:hypothetical protein
MRRLSRSINSFGTSLRRRKSKRASSAERHGTEDEVDTCEPRAQLEPELERVTDSAPSEAAESAAAQTMQSMFRGKRARQASQAAMSATSGLRSSPSGFKRLVSEGGHALTSAATTSVNLVSDGGQALKNRVSDGSQALTHAVQAVSKGGHALTHAAKSSVRLVSGGLGLDGPTAADHAVEDLGAPTPAENWWTPREGWKAHMLHKHAGWREAPENLMPTLALGAPEALFDESDVVGELRLEVLELP